MKGLKARFLNKLQLIPTINSLRKGLASHQPNNPQQQQQQQQQHTNSNQNLHSTQSVHVEQDCKINNINLPEQVTDHSNDQKGKQTDLDQSDVPHQGNNNKLTPKIELKYETIPKHPSLQDFEEKCPPGGEDSVVLYTTSLRGVRKTFHDCSSVRYILSSFKILVHERDVSMDMEFRDELWRLFGEKVVPPKLFIKGRYIGGADEIIGLHEEGVLRKLLEGLPSNLPITCTHCANMKFLVCPNCDGSRKVFAETEDDDDDEELCLQCPDCNENGLVKCPNCC